jgi:hypothetical protein
MDNSTDYYTNPPSSEQETCIDRDGREILDGFLLNQDLLFCLSIRHVKNPETLSNMFLS